MSLKKIQDDSSCHFFWKKTSPYLRNS